jgi:dTDP-4-amino-4,6-dideoxygalactose transaminase
VNGESNATPTIRYMNLAVTDPDERRALIEAVDAVLGHGQILLGPEAERFEARVAAHCGRKYAVGVGSGTDALILGLHALGVGPGDEVVTTALSYVANANAPALLGAVPVYADITEDLTLDPDSVAACITAKTKAIVAVDFTGRMADLPAIEALGRRHGIPVVEDASQSFGARLAGRPAGGFGDMACVSFNPMKLLAACGEAGVVLTDDANVRDMIRAFRHNGLVNKEECRWVSHNARLDTIQAAILLARLDRLDAVLARRAAIARRYNAALSALVRVPRLDDGQERVFYTYQVLAEDRDGLSAFLAARGIENKVHFRYLLPDHPAHAAGARGHYPRARELGRRNLSLPCHEKLTDDEVERVIKAVREFYSRPRGAHA